MGVCNSDVVPQTYFPFPCKVHYWEAELENDGNIDGKPSYAVSVLGGTVRQLHNGWHDDKVNIALRSKTFVSWTHILRNSHTWRRSISSSSASAHSTCLGLFVAGIGQLDGLCKPNPWHPSDLLFPHPFHHGDSKLMFKSLMINGLHLLGHQCHVYSTCSNVVRSEGGIYAPTPQ